MLTPHAPCRRVAYFIAVVPFLPVTLAYPIPFPGINFLTIITPLRLCIVLILLPLLLRGPQAAALAPLPSAAIVCFVIYTSILGAQGQGVTVTAGIRFFVDQTLLYAVPILLIPTAIRSEKDLEDCVSAFIAVSAILAMIALISAVKQWNFYANNDFAEFRSGDLRVTATANTHSLGFHLAAALLLLEAAKRYVTFSFLRIMTLRVVLLGGLYFTGSRGAVTALLAGALVLIVLKPKSAGVRRALLASLTLLGIIAGLWLVTGDFSKLDPHGTFVYRQELVATAMAYLREHLLFGDVNFLKSGRFDHLIQGQGIVDITNYYLQIALQYGLVGVFLLFSVFAAIVISLGVTLLHPWEVAADDRRFTVRASLLAALVAWLVLVTTTSDVGLTLYLGLLFAALGHAAITLGKRTLPSAVSFPLTGVLIAEFVGSTIGMAYIIITLLVSMN